MLLVSQLGQKIYSNRHKGSPAWKSNVETCCSSCPWTICWRPWIFLLQSVRIADLWIVDSDAWYRISAKSHRTYTSSADQYIGRHEVRIDCFQFSKCSQEYFTPCSHRNYYSKIECLCGYFFLCINNHHQLHSLSWLIFLYFLWPL